MLLLRDAEATELRCLREVFFGFVELARRARDLSEAFEEEAHLLLRRDLAGGRLDAEIRADAERLRESEVGQADLAGAVDLPAAGRYLSAMFGFGDAMPAAALIGAILYTPYSIASLAIAALVAWAAPQTWDWTRRMTAPKAALALACLALALIAMGSQGFNPFIYFNF